MTYVSAIQLLAGLSGFLLSLPDMLDVELGLLLPGNRPVVYYGYFQATTYASPSPVNLVTSTAC